MITLKSKAVLTVALLLGTTGFAQTRGASSSGKVANPAAFSLKGLRLGMTIDQARPIMQKLAKENHVVLHDNGGSRCISETISALKEHRQSIEDGNGKCVQRMGFDYANNPTFRVNLEFAEDLPKSPGTMRLWHIELDETDLNTDADLKAFFSVIIEKYGSPTFATTEEIIYCSEVGSEKTCRVGDANMDVPYKEETKTARLKCCYFAPQLGRTGFYAKADRGWLGPSHYNVSVNLYDTTLPIQSEREKMKMIGETRTVAKPVF